MWQIDAKNAFGSIKRKIIYEELFLHFPSIISFFNLFYKNPSKLRLLGSHKEVIWVDNFEGVHQGDPLGPFYFALAEHKVIREITSNPKYSQEVAVEAYLDDLLGAGRKGSTSKSFNDFLDKLSPIGLVGNLKRCIAWGKNHSPLDFREGTTILNSANTGGLKQLGAPVGSIEFESKFCDEYLTKQDQEGFRLIEKMKDKQSALHLLRYASKNLNFIFTRLVLRDLPPAMIVWSGLPSLISLTSSL